ncbi:MAG: DUF2281 domain-containing protein [Limnothrix sp. CACIAM 69d]|nr:MAG: DUF2281 domain-containing protein [Limnothrix sp. CACIAM 69d]
MQSVIIKKFEKLPKPLQIEVLHYIEFLLEKYVQQTAASAPTKKRKAGLLKGKIWMADDFDAPLEDLRDYM